MDTDRSAVLARIAAVARDAAMTGMRIIGVDGPSGAGKSTLAGAVADHLRAPIVEIDDFVSWRQFDGWWPRFDAQVLGALLAGRDANYQVRDWVGDEFGDRLAGWKTLPWQHFVVFEGVTCTRAVAAAALACRVWVEAPAAERLRRGIARDGESHRKLWEAWMVDEERFFASDDTRSRADIVVDGTAS